MNIPFLFEYLLFFGALYVDIFFIADSAVENTQGFCLITSNLCFTGACGRSVSFQRLLFWDSQYRGRWEERRRCHTGDRKDFEVLAGEREWADNLHISSFCRTITNAIVQFPTDQLNQKAEFLLQKGRCLNVAPDYSAEAEKCLSRAVKLEPGLVDGWNTLGEQYWKKGDLMGAKNCFTGALQQVWTKEFTTFFTGECSQNPLLLNHLCRARIKCRYAACLWCWGSCRRQSRKRPVIPH